ncbi:MAG: hypothetical protein KTR33_06350 [Gammaproteobacteria bacterium]|nr:hypothetical protein [Gammaproteobacteria bacterium]
MKRRSIHAGFAVVTAILTGTAAVQLLELREISRTESAIEAITTDSGKPVLAEAQLAWANIKSLSGEFDKAESTFNDLIRQHPQQPVGQAALFNLANSYMRQGMRAELQPGQSRALIELAKQRYRDLLRLNPSDWDARYNLERALQLAPEAGNASVEDDKGKPIKSVNVVVPDFKIRDLP